jgi:CDP-glucose 4,6-dehydratase
MNVFGGAYKGKRVLVTGHTGFKGSWLTEWLLELGAEVAGFSNGIPSKPSHFEELKTPSRIRHHVGDVRDLAALQEVFNDFKPQVVFHLAAQAIVRASYEDPKSTFDVNVGGTVNVLECMRGAPSLEASVIVTSDKCYENVEWEFGYRETDHLGGHDPYSASKACAEITFSAYARSFFTQDRARIASARAGNVIGGGDWAKDRIIPDCVRAWSQGKPVMLRNPQSTRPWQHVLEPLSGYLWLGAQLLQSKPQIAGEAFNFGPPASVNQPVDALIAEMKKTWSAGNWTMDPSAAAEKSSKKEAGLLKLNCDKALHRLGWEPTLEFPETALMTGEWYKKYYESPTSAPELTRSHIQKYQRLAFERGRVWIQ